MAAAASDVNEVFSRLFDHRPFLKGEIEFFKKEFEARVTPQSKIMVAMPYTHEYRNTACPCAPLQPDREKEKRGDREVEHLFRSLELITEIKEGQIEKIVGSSDDNLPRTIADIQVALHMCEDTLDTETKFNSEELLAKKRSERTTRLATVQHDVQEKLKVLEETHKEKEKAMRARFQQLESRAGCV